MYNNYSIAGASIAAPTSASFLPLDFPLGPSTEPFWLLLGGFAIFAALSAAKRIAPTWTQLVGSTTPSAVTEAASDAPVQASAEADVEGAGDHDATRAAGRHRAPARTRTRVFA
ncbi:MAG: hypothetical protein IPK37_06850 [Austwickia sp.]|jgi:hypothetical protein|nr:MAG: hypothetical protein IPK37_06850 [Austwickia sp.]